MFLYTHIDTHTHTDSGRRPWFSDPTVGECDLSSAGYTYTDAFIHTCTDRQTGRRNTHTHTYTHSQYDGERARRENR